MFLQEWNRQQFQNDINYRTMSQEILKASKHECPEQTLQHVMHQAQVSAYESNEADEVTEQNRQ